jgi:hypothetical protein
LVYPKTFRKSIEAEGKKFSVIIFELENAVFSFFFEDDLERVGTIALAIPQTASTLNVSSILLGDRNIIPARILAEFFASKFKKMSFSSVFSKQINDTQISKILLSLAKAVV